MANETELGKAVIPIRATMEDLDADLAGAQGRVRTMLGGVGRVAGIATAAIVGGGIAAAGALGNLAAQAAPLEGVQNAFAGITGDAEGMLASLQEGSMGMATNADLMESYNSAAQLVGKTFADQLPDAMGFLGKVAAATGDDMGFMIDSLVKGVGRLSPQILDNLGIQVNLAQATENAAQTYGVEADALSKAQIQAGMMNVTLAALAENTAAMPDITDNAATKMAQLETTMTNLKDTAGLALLPVFTEITGILGTLVEEHGPMITGLLETLGSLLGDVVGGALEILVPMFVSLLETLAPLAETLLGMLFPALSAILEAVVPLAAALIESLVPVLEAVLGAVLPVAVMLVEMLAPILVDLATGLIPVLVPLIEGLAQIFGRLLVAIMPLIEMLLTSLMPVFLQIIEAVLPPLIDVLLILLDLFVTYVEATLPNFIAILELILPIIGALAVIVAEGLGLALEGLAGVLETVVKPALQWVIDHLFNPLLEILERMKAGLEGVTGWFKNLGKTIGDLELPPWLIPGSPTPLELGLKGIGNQVARVTGLMHGLDAGLSMSVVSGGTGGQWSGDIYINGAGNPQATADAVIRALRDRGMMPQTSFR